VTRSPTRRSCLPAAPAPRADTPAGRPAADAEPHGVPPGEAHGDAAVAPRRQIAQRDERVGGHRAGCGSTGQDPVPRQIADVFTGGQRHRNKDIRAEHLGVVEPSVGEAERLRAPHDLPSIDPSRAQPRNLSLVPQLVRNGMSAPIFSTVTRPYSGSAARSTLPAARGGLESSPPSGPSGSLDPFPPAWRGLTRSRATHHGLTVLMACVAW
jgi:hypothetical protein